MLGRYPFQGGEIDSLDLKSLIVTRGVRVRNRVYGEFRDTCRIDPNPLTCNCLILPDGTIAQLTDVGLHLRYLKQAMSLESMKQLGTFFQGWRPFDLDVSESGRALLSYNGEKITNVGFPTKSGFYQQKTSSGLPFIGNAVLQGIDTLAFQSLWPCELARAGYPCQFCYTGGISEQLAKKHKPEPAIPTSRDSAEIVDYAVNQERMTKYIQITGGSTMNPQAECHRIKQILEEIDSVVGLKRIEGEILVFTTPPSDPRLLDKIFDAGADRVACSLEVWDESLAEEIIPGKTKFTTRKRHVDALRYVAKEYGPNKACSTFVVGLEPVESFLEGAESLSREGIVSIASLWIPFGRPVMGRSKAPPLEYYRRVKMGLAEMYQKYGIVPPGGAGFNTDIDKDIWYHRTELLDAASAQAA
jgi:hypothetical protein